MESLAGMEWNQWPDSRGIGGRDRLEFAIYKLRWQIETFFAWWKRHLKVYHLISRSRHGLMIQMLAGLITYILLAIYCQEEHGEPVSIHRVRQLRNQILNESRIERAEPTMQGQPNPVIIHASP